MPTIAILAAVLATDTSRSRPQRDSWVRPGHTFVVYYRGIVELDRGGKEVWRFRREGLRAAYRLPDATVLAVDSVRKKLLVVRQDGGIVWEHATGGKHLFHAAPQRDGTTWTSCVGDDSGGFAARIDRKGGILEKRSLAWPLTIQGLRDGRLLANQHQAREICEIDRSGRTVWSWKSDGEAYSVARLANGNTLIGRAHDVVEVDRDGRRVWECRSPAGSYHYAVKRLRNGNTLLAGLQGTLVEVNRDGREVWRYEDKEFQIQPYPGPIQIDRGE